ncbi:MAG: hypothetical protein PHT02_07010 [Tissierellia bacterium]|nr:hypothetical protein [Tissierellia bacterium]
MQKEHWGYVIKDSFGGYNGHLRLVRNEEKTRITWGYVAFKNVFQGYGNKVLALAEIEKLKELNQIAQIPNLTWELVYTDVFSIPQIGDNLYSRLEEVEYDIPFGRISETRKAAKEIWKKYKTIFADIEKEWRAKKAV